MLKIEVGKFYRTRGGWKAKVVADDYNGDWPLLVVHYKKTGMTTSLNLPDGRYPDIDHDEDQYDLVAEWVDPPKPLECWVVIADGHIVACSLEEFSDNAAYEALAKGFEIKHMREVVNE